MGGSSSASLELIYTYGQNLINRHSFYGGVVFLSCHFQNKNNYKIKKNCISFFSSWCFSYCWQKCIWWLIVFVLGHFFDGWFQVVHPAPGNANGTLVNAILHHCGLPTAAIPSSDIFPESEDSLDAEFDSFPADQNSGEEISSNICTDSVRPGIVHRLDKGTSGLLVVAKVIPIFGKDAWEHEIGDKFVELWWKSSILCFKLLEWLFVTTCTT